jgi:PAS domain S-box-containing protein
MTEQCQSVLTASKESVNSKHILSQKISPEHIQSRYGDLMDLLPIIIYIVEPHPPYAPIYLSKGIETLGYTHEDWCNTPNLWINSIHEDDRERILEETRKAFAEKGTTDYEYRFYTRDGSVYWFHDKGRFVYDEDGKPISWEGFLLDVTERKQAENNGENNAEKIGKSISENSRKTILLVEDEEIIRDMMREILLNAGYDITVAKSGIEAFKICETGGKTFDLVITDFNMPEMNGRELAEKLKSVCGSTEILFISGYTDDEDFLQEISTSDKNFIAKPFSPEILVLKVKEILAKD